MPHSLCRAKNGHTITQSEQINVAKVVQIGSFDLDNSGGVLATDGAGGAAGIPEEIRPCGAGAATAQIDDGNDVKKKD